MKSKSKINRPQGEIRIIGGEWRSRRLPVLTKEGLRPTSDRVRETIFNWLQHMWGGQWADKRGLDAFAGSGALGFEAASRGVGYVVLVEKDAAVAAQLRSNAALLQASACHVRHDSALDVLQSSATGAFDVVFCDPPFHRDWLPQCLPQIHRVLADEGYLYLETEVGLDLSEFLTDWQMVRESKAGQVQFGLYQKAFA